jgi:hypothetical protein
MSDPYYELWDKVEVKTEEKSSSDTDPTVEDGKYTAVIENFRCWESEASELWVKWFFTITDGPYAGRLLVRLAAPLGRRDETKEKRLQKVERTKKDFLKVLGTVPAVMGEVFNPETGTTGPVVASLIGLHVNVTKQTNGKYINVYIEELVEVPTVQAPTPEPSFNAAENFPRHMAVTTEDVPF